MYLIADSGSTKTDWRIVSHTQEISFQTKGLNPYFIDSEGIFDVVNQQFPKNISKTEISKIYFYGSGCKSDESKHIVSHGLAKLFPKSKIVVKTDLEGAAIALLGEEKGVISILGTGMSIGIWNGKEVTKTLPSLGFILGDEGSGAYIGKMFIKAIFEGELSPEIIEKFTNQYQIELPEVLENVYRKSFPNKYLASFVKFVCVNKEEPTIQFFLSTVFNNFVENHVLKIIGNSELKSISFVGSIAYFFEDILKIELQKHSISIHSIEASPIDKLCVYFKNEF